MSNIINNCAYLSDDAYKDRAVGEIVDFSDSSKWKVLSSSTALQDNPEWNSSSGFAAAAYYRVDAAGKPLLKDGELDVVVAYRGTEPEIKEDWKTNLEIAFDIESKANSQFNQAKDFFTKDIDEAIKNNAEISGYYNPEDSVNNKINFTITGHSLGGGLAQIVGSANGEETYTFNAIGVKHLADGHGAGGNTDKVHNYVVRGDIIGQLYDHIGDVQYIDAQPPVDISPFIVTYNGQATGYDFSVYTDLVDNFATAHNKANFLNGLEDATPNLGVTGTSTQQALLPIRTVTEVLAAIDKIINGVSLGKADIDILKAGFIDLGVDGVFGILNIAATGKILLVETKEKLHALITELLSTNQTEFSLILPDMPEASIQISQGELIYNSNVTEDLGDDVQNIIELFSDFEGLNLDSITINTESYEVHTVAEGDRLWKIAREEELAA